MICAIDFGSCWIRCIFRNPDAPGRLSMFAERSEYALISNTEQHRRLLENQHVPFAECEGTLAVVGSIAEKVQWLSRVPRTPLLVDGGVPVDDPPARQMLSVLTGAMLPPLPGERNLCVLTVPGLRDGSEQALRNEEFLCRLVRMQGYRALVVDPAEASLLATCNDASFTGISIVMGAETTTICIARHSMPLATESLSIGGNWIDAEIARQFQVKVWDEEGNAYLDIESIREWKLRGSVHLKNAQGDRERLLSRLYSVVLDRVAGTVSRMLSATPVCNAIQRQRLPVMLAGGATMIDGFSGLLTEQFVVHEIAERILSVRCAQDPATAVVRGALIYGELESRGQKVVDAA